jgi:hypothetical protein
MLLDILFILAFLVILATFGILNARCYRKKARALIEDIIRSGKS